jgi:hypothetical protein
MAAEWHQVLHGAAAMSKQLFTSRILTWELFRHLVHVEVCFDRLQQIRARDKDLVDNGMP